MVKTAPGRSGRLPASIRPPIAEAATDRKAEAGPGPLSVARRNAIELVEQAVEILRWNARSFVDHLNDRDVVLHLGADLYSRAGRRILGGVVEQVEQRLFQENPVQRQHRQVGREVEADAVLGDEDEREIADVQKLPEGKADRGGADHGCERNHVREQMHLLLLRSAVRRCGRRRLFVLPGHDQNADVSGATDQVMHHRPVQHLEPARTARLADDDVSDVVGLCVSDDVVHDVRARYRECCPAQLVSKPQAGGDPVAFAIGQPMMTSGLDVERRPRRVQRVREPPGVPDKAQRSRVFANADEHARARRPWTADGVRLHMRKQLVVDALRRPPQGQLAQGGQISR